MISTNVKSLSPIILKNVPHPMINFEETEKSVFDNTYVKIVYIHKTRQIILCNIYLPKLPSPQNLFLRMRCYYKTVTFDLFQNQQFFDQNISRFE